MAEPVKDRSRPRGGKRGSRPNLTSTPTQRELKSPLDGANGYEVVWPQVTDLFSACRGIRDVSFVYFIGETEDDGAVKIGVAKDPIKRLRQMQTGNPRRLKLEQVILGDRYLERFLHEVWEDFAIRSARQRSKVDTAPGTEWFRPEIREALLPVIATAAEAQVKHIARKEEGGIECEHLLTILRAAHGRHGVVGKPKVEPLRYMAPHGMGYVVGGRKTVR